MVKKAEASSGAGGEGLGLGRSGHGEKGGGVGGVEWQRRGGSWLGLARAEKVASVRGGGGQRRGRWDFIG